MVGWREKGEVVGERVPPGRWGQESDGQDSLREV